MNNRPPLQITGNVPARGFYYHKNHKPGDPVNAAAYEVLSVSVNSMDQYPPEYAETVAYRPLYEHKELPRSRSFSQPLRTFVEQVEVQGVPVPRFKLISDPAIIGQLVRLRKQMYGD